MTEASLKEKTAKGLFWGGIGNGAMQLLNLVFGIFLARLLSTTDYGMVAVLTIFSAMAGIFSESGFILALVNKKEVKHEEYNSVFWFNISIGASLYLILPPVPGSACGLAAPSLCPVPSSPAPLGAARAAGCSKYRPAYCRSVPRRARLSAGGYLFRS